MKTGYVYKKANKANPSVPSILKKKVLQIALMILLTTQIVQPFFVAYADVNRNGLINNNNGPFKAPAQGDTVNVDTWSDLEKLGTKQGDAYVIESDIEKNYTIKLKQDVVAASPIIIKDNVHVHISSNDNDNKTIYREEDNTNFTVFTVDNGGTLTLGDHVIMTGDVASEYSKIYTLTVKDGAGNTIYKKHVYPDNDEKTIDDLLNTSNIYVSLLPSKEVIFEEDATGTQGTDWNAVSKSLNDVEERKSAFDYLFENKPDSPYKKGFTFDEWDFGNVDKTKKMSEIDGDVTVVAKWKGHYLFKVTDGFGNIIYKEKLDEGETRSCEKIMSDAGLIDANSRNSKLTAALQGKNGPYEDGYQFDSWNYGEVVPSRPHNELVHNDNVTPTSITVIARWKTPYKLTVTDGYGNTIYQNNDVDKTKNINELMSYTTVGNLTTDADRTNAFNNTLKNESSSPYYENNGQIEYDFVSWNYGNDANGNAINGNTTMSTVGGDLTVGATWKKKFTFTVTDGYRNKIYEKKNISINDNTTVQSLMQNASDWDLLKEASRNNALANTLAGKESPQNHEYTFKNWSYGKDKNGNDVGLSTTMSSLGGNLTVCATWDPPSGIEEVWDIPNPLDDNTTIELGDQNGRYVGINSSNKTEWADDYVNALQQWKIKNVQNDGTFELVSAANENRKLYVAKNFNYKQFDYNKYQNEYRYPTIVTDEPPSNPDDYHSRFKFEKDGNLTYLVCYDSFMHDQGARTIKVYMIDNPGNQQLQFSSLPAYSTMIHAGIPKSPYDFDDPDTPGYSAADELNGTDSIGASPISSLQPTDSPGKQLPPNYQGGPNYIEGPKPNVDSPGSSPVGNDASSYNKINSTSIESALYSKNGNDTNPKPIRQNFVSENKGFFVKVNNGGTFDLEGATLHNFNTVSVADNTPVGVAPVYVEGNFTMTKGYIENNNVGYIANDSLSGLNTTKRAGDYNVESGPNDVKEYLKSQKPTKTAGGIIFANGATGVITGDSYIRQNHGDAGGIIVNGLDTDVTIGGSLKYEETNVPYTVVATDGSESQSNDYYVKCNDGKYHLSDEIPTGVSRLDDKTYKVSIDSSSGGGHINQNVGFHYAGAALVENGATLRMVGENSTMNNNVTWNRGGAVYVTEYGTGGDGTGVKKSKDENGNGCIVKDSNGIPVNKQEHGEGTFIMTNGTIDGNTAFIRGGGINVESNRVFLIGGVISSNYCRSLGGGIYVEGDYADYSYTLVLNRGYIGTNYAVRYWDLDDFNDAENDVYSGLNNTDPGKFNGRTLSELNDILDRKLGHPDANGNPIAVDNNGYPVYSGDAVEIASGTDYPNRTADVRDFRNPHEGNGGGIWLCPIGGTAVFHMNADNEVIIDDNYASGSFSGDNTKGSDLYLHSGTGHMLVQNEVTEDQTLEKWINEDTGNQIPENGPVYSGPLYLKNDTDPNQKYIDTNGRTTTYAKRKDIEEHKGIHIVDNISRDGGGIAADGTLLFGLPNDVYRHEAKLDFVKIWPANNNEDTHPVKFKMFYEKDGELIPIPSYDLGLDGTNNAADDYTINPETGSSSSQNSNSEIVWKAKATIPVSVELSDGTQYPMYGLKYNGTETVTYNITDSLTETSITVNRGDVMYPNTRVGMQKLFAIAQESEKIVNNGGSPIELEIVDWKIVIKEFDDKGQELRTAEFLNIVGRAVTVSNDNSIPIDVIDAGGVGKKIKGYNINFSSAEFYSEVKNNKGPTIEKYIDKKVHRNLTAFDETFEYEIMAYVPLDADEIIIYDTLQEPLMFVSNSGTPQYTTNSNQVNETFKKEFRDDPDFFMIKNANGYNQMAIFDENNHLGDETGTVSNSGTAFTDAVAQAAKGKTNPMKAHNVRIGTLNKTDGKVTGVTASNDGNSLFIKVDKNSGIEAVRGKWIKATFKAAIKPEYRDLEKLKSDDGWLTNEDLKVGGPAYYGKSITFTGSGWEKLSGIEELVGKQFIVQAAAQNPETNSIYRFAKDEDGNYYAIKYKDDDAKWFRIKDTDEEPSIDLAKKRLGEIANHRYGFADLDLSTSIEYFNHDDFVVANNTSLNGATAKRGAYGNGDWMFLEDSAGNYYYAVKDQNVKLDSGSNKYQLKEGVSEVNWIKVDDIPEGQRPTNLTDSLIEDRLNGNSATKMDLTSYSYNWPIEDKENHMSQQPHQGEANQAHMVVDAKNTYDSNIVTVDILQPEKYVNDKVHEILRHDQSAQGAFDQVFEYEIMVYVPKDVQEFVIWDTLRDDLMFVDRHGKTQYRTYTIGTEENPVSSTQHGNDKLNTEFMSQVDGQDTNTGMTLIANDGHSIDPENDGNSHQLQWYKTNDHKGDGTGTVSTSGNDVNGPIENAGYIGIIDESNIPANGNWSTLPENNTAGNTIFIKFDETTGIDTVREKWVKVTFFAQIKPSRYIDIVNKLQKSSRHTNNKALAVDYDATANPNPKPVGYNYRTSELTSIKMNAKGYNPVEDTVPTSSIKGYYAKNPDTGYFTDFVNNQPSGTEGTDWIYAYESAFVYHTESIDDIPADVKSKGTSEYEAVYLKKGWNDTDDNISWEKVTDDGYVKDGINLYRNNNSKEAYLDVQADGSHAGLANKANYAIKIDNKWNSISTNTVTVVPLLRTITVKKMWIVDEDTPIPSAHELLEHIHLYWEKITNLDDTQSSDHGRTVGKITELYRNNITIVQEKVEDLTGKTRYTWRIEVKDLPQLRPSMKYFIEEKQFDGFNPPRYLNPSDPEATEHAHDTGSIINSMDSDDTELLVTKKWDVGAGDYENENIIIRLLADGEPVWKRDNQFKIVRDDNNNKIEDTSYTKDINSAEEWFILFSSLPKYQRDDNGNYITEPATDINGVAIYDLITGEQVKNRIPIVYSVEVLSDPENYILSKVSRSETNYIETQTVNKQEADDFGIDLGAPYDKKAVQDKGHAKKVGYYVYNIIHETIYIDGYTRIESHIDYSNETFYSELDVEDIRNIAPMRCEPDLPETGDISTINACYLEVYKKTESYLSYEVDLVNTKPQIEKYINKDVHYETFIGNEFTYDIIVYVPEEATEIEIMDELLPTLSLKSIEQPIISSESKEITGYDSIFVNQLPKDIQLAIHGENNHTINGTVNSDTVFGNVKGTVNTYGNGFKVNINNIVPYGTSYVVDENGEYLYVKDHLGNKYYKKADELSYYKEIEYDSFNTDDRADSVYVRVLDSMDNTYQYWQYSTYLWHNANPERFTMDPGNSFYEIAEYRKIDDNHYRSVNQKRYVENNNGDFIKLVNKSDSYKILFVDKNTDLTKEQYADYERLGTKYYSYDDSVDQAIGGKYVQVTFKAGFDLTDSKVNAMKQWISNPWNFTSSNPNPELNWDVITNYGEGTDGRNKGWDKYIESLGYNKATDKFIPADSVMDYQIVNLMNAIGKDNISSVIKKAEYYVARANNNLYICPINPTQFPENKDVWLKVDQGVSIFTGDRRTRFFTLDEVEVRAWENDRYNYNYIDSQTGTNLLADSSKKLVPIQADEYVLIDNNYYLRDVAKLYAPNYDDSTATIYRKIDWGRGDGDVIRNNSSEYGTNNHAGVVNTASYEVTYGNGYKSNHKSNTVTVVPEIYELPSSGGMGTFLFNILGAMFITLALTEIMSNRRKRKKSI